MSHYQPIITSEAECLFCQIVNQQIPSYPITQSEHAIAILDAFPASKAHCLIISKKHYSDLMTTEKLVLADMMFLAQKTAQFLSQVYPEIQGFNYLSNQGKIAGQSVFHTHVHIIPKYQTDQGFYFDVSRQEETKDELNVIQAQLLAQIK